MVAKADTNTSTLLTSIAFTRPEYSEMVSYWELMDDVVSSEKNIHEKGEDYIPKLTNQDDTQYLAYVKRGAFPLFTKHALINFVGMALRKDTMTTGINEDFKDNVDGIGTTLDGYIKKLLDGFLLYGRAVTYIEYDNFNKRTKLLYYSAKSVINWRTRIIDNVEQLSLLVLREGVEEYSDEFTFTTQFRYRVLSLDPITNNYRQRVIDHLGVVIENHTPTHNHKPIKEIPAVIHGGIVPQLPVLLPIAEQNIHYYKLDVNYKHGLHYTALPTPWMTGVDGSKKNKDKPTTLGPTVMWYLPDEATCGMLEFTGRGLGEYKNAKKECLENIITLSSQILAPPQNANETATAASIRNAGETASLAELVGMLSREMTLLVKGAQDWMSNTSSEVEIVINNDFVPTILSGADVASYTASEIKGGMSAKTRFALLKKGEIVEGDRSFEDEQADIEAAKKKEADETVELAGRVAEVEAKYTPTTENDPEQNSDDQNKSKTIKDGKQTPQVNKGQGFAEN